MPSAANLNRLCCWVSCKVKLFKPLKMMGSTLHGFQLGYTQARVGVWVVVLGICDAVRCGAMRGARHTVRDDNGIITLDGLVGHRFGEVYSKQDRVHLAAQRVEGRLQEHWGERKVNTLFFLVYLSPASFMFLHPVLSKLLSASDSG